MILFPTSLNLKLCPTPLPPAACRWPQEAASGLRSRHGACGTVVPSGIRVGWFRAIWLPVRALLRRWLLQLETDLAVVMVWGSPSSSKQLRAFCWEPPSIKVGLKIPVRVLIRSTGPASWLPFWLLCCCCWPAELTSLAGSGRADCFRQFSGEVNQPFPVSRRSAPVAVSSCLGLGLHLLPLTALP